MNAILPIPRCEVNVRVATLADVAFIDSLQKLHAKQVGWMPTKQIEQKVLAGQVVVAEEVGSRQKAVGREEAEENLLPTAYCLPPTALGYCIGHDQYFKRDDVGIVYQLNVAPTEHRKLIGAMLLKEVFARAAYGCRLFCCWCAQDIEANRFWEAMGFVPLAFRTGSAKKSRVHIFWQRRVREGDMTTPWWFPAKTDAGAMREDRLVLPIPPGLHWSDEMPVIVAGEATKPESEKATKRLAGPPSALRSGPVKHGPRQFGPPPSATTVVETVPAKPKREKAPKQKADPKLVAAARELRDRWLERVNEEGFVLEGRGKYDVSRLPGEARPAISPPDLKQLPAAA